MKLCRFSSPTSVWCHRLSSSLEQRQVPRRSPVLGQGWYGFGVLQYIDKVVDVPVVIQRQVPSAFRLPTEHVEEFHILPMCSCSLHSHSDSGQLLRALRIWQTLATVYTRHSTVAFGRIPRFFVKVFPSRRLYWFSAFFYAIFSDSVSGCMPTHQCHDDVRGQLFDVYIRPRVLLFSRLQMYTLFS